MAAYWAQTGGQWGCLQTDESLSFVNFQGQVCGVSLRVSAVQVWVKGVRWFADPSPVFPTGICEASIT